MSEHSLYRLLIVDDERERRQLAAKSLRESALPALIELLADAGEGPKRVNDDWDCIVLGAGADSGAVLERYADLLRRGCDERAPVVLIASLADESVAVEATRHGVQACIERATMTPASLRRAVENAIARAHMQRALEARDEKSRRLTLHDALTGLANRTLFLDRLDQGCRVAERNRERFAVLMMDLDFFREINETLGHEVGDEVLRGVACRIDGQMRESDTVARMGGDEFAVLLAATGEAEGACIVAQKISDAMAEPFIVNGRSVRVGISIGVALWATHGRDRITLLRHADGAMHEAKRAGGGVVVHGAPVAGSQARRTLIAKGLSRALDSDEFRLCYQPQLDMRSGEVVGAEALLRWKHPDLGLLPPMEFIPSAERSALIGPLTLQVIERALHDLCAWRAEGLEIGMAVNLAPRLLRDAGFASEVATRLRDAGVEPGRLTFELSESRMVGSMATTERGLAALHALGVRLAIDDFGTGYTSLQHLRTLPVDEIKIDRNFVAGMGEAGRDYSIVRAILELGAGFAVRVVAEGVESERAWRHLRALGCSHGQGFHFSPALPAAEFRAWCRRWHAAARSGETLPGSMQATG